MELERDGRTKIELLLHAFVPAEANFFFIFISSSDIVFSYS